jgi:hypothetical protein
MIHFPLIADAVPFSCLIIYLKIDRVDERCRLEAQTGALFVAYGVFIAFLFCFLRPARFHTAPPTQDQTAIIPRADSGEAGGAHL